MANGGNAKVHPDSLEDEASEEMNDVLDTAVVNVLAPEGVRVKSEASTGNGHTPDSKQPVRRSSTFSTASVSSINVGGKPVTWTRIGTAVGISVVMLLLIVGIVIVYVTKDPTVDEPSQHDAEETTGAGLASACFAAGTLLETRDGTLRRIEDVQIGDHLALGGRVTARMEFEAKRAQLFRYDVGGAADHPVLERDGVWRRVHQAVNSTPIDDATWRSLAPAGGIDRARVFDLDTQRHRLLVRPTLGSPGTVFSDFSEVDADHPLVQNFERALIADLMATADRDLRTLEV